MLALLAEGMSGAAIAERLVLSPETVRTHVRNAMEKLGAATRSQAIAVALERAEIEGPHDGAAVTARRAQNVSARGGPVPSREATLNALLAGLVSLPDLDGGSIYVAEEDGLMLRLVARVGARGIEAISRRDAEVVHLGEGPVGRVALEGRTELFGGGGQAMIAAPMSNGRRLAGVLCLSPRPSRPTSRRELLLVEAFGNRVAEVLVADREVGRNLKVALERFRASWAGVTA